jgi:hypothetical protein
MSQDQGQDDRHDDVLQKGNSLMEEDRREKIATCTYFRVTRSVVTFWLTSFPR